MNPALPQMQSFLSDDQPMLNASDIPLRPVPSNREPKKPFIGLYGISGSGKTTLLRHLEQVSGMQQFKFFDSSEQIRKVLPNKNLNSMAGMSEPQKVRYREQAIENIVEECTSSGQIAVVAGHMLLRGSQAPPEPVHTQKDLDTYTHILYLDVDPKIVAKRRSEDSKKDRPKDLSVEDLCNWQKEEKELLKTLCRKNGILYSVMAEPLSDRLLALLKDIQLHAEEHNLTQALMRLDATMAPKHDTSKTILVFDADKTLAAQDTGKLFWEHVNKVDDTRDATDPLKTLFSSSMGYSYTAFRQATLLYEAFSEEDFDDHCAEVASQVNIYPDMVSLLEMVLNHRNVDAVVVTSGLRCVWKQVLSEAGLGHVQVIGGGRISDGYVVNSQVKAAIVERIRKVHKKEVWAFGDGPLDLAMLKQAHRAVVVVGDKITRSRGMEQGLTKAVNEGLHAHQILFPPNTEIRLDEQCLPPINRETLIHTIFGIPPSSNVFDPKVIQVTGKSSSKLLATQTRNAKISGPNLRKAHQYVGRYLATEYLSSDNVLGLETYQITHVQDGKTTTGHRILHESETTIVALMRGGEPMAFGVSDVMPAASFVHAKQPTDIKAAHIDAQRNIILVDSVIVEYGQE